MKATRSVEFRLTSNCASVMVNVALFGTLAAAALRAQSGPSLSAAYHEISQRVMANSASFYVYLDEDSGLNHAYPSGVFPAGASLGIDAGCIDDPADETLGCYPSTDTTQLDTTRGTVLRITFPSLPGTDFAGLNIEEPENWGALFAAGECGTSTTCNPYDLTGATTVEFDVRSPTGINVQYGVGQCQTSFSNLAASRTYTHVSLGLNTSYLSCAPDLSSINVLFTVTAQNVPNGATILLDNIQFASAPPRANQQGETLSLPLSTQTYGVVPQFSTNPPPDQLNRNVATVYEAALSIFALIQRGQPQDLTNAQAILSALHYALYDDNHGDFIPTSPNAASGCFGGIAASQCGLHNAYENGDIGLLNSQVSPAKGIQGDVRLAGYTCGNLSPTEYCLVLDGATSGNNAWAMLALLAAYQQFDNATYLNDAISIGNWIVGLEDASGNGYGGYFAGYPDMGKPKVLETGKSTENNADIFAAMNWLSQIEAGQGNSAAAAQWNENATAAANFVMAMYDSVNGRFYPGTTPVGGSLTSGCSAGPQKGNDVINVGPKGFCDFLDADSFTTLALSGSQQFGPYSASSGQWQPALSYVQNLTGANTFTQTITANSLTFSGIDLIPAPAETGIAWEFTGQMVESCNYLDAILNVSTFSSCPQTYLPQVAQAQAHAPFGDGSGIVGATLNGENSPPDNLPPGTEYLATPFQNIPERATLAATNWAILSASSVNPLAFYPQPALSKTSLGFGSQAIGVASAAQTVTLVNAGTAPLSIPTFEINGANSDDFAETNNCMSSLATGDTCTVSVTFTPLGPASRTASLTITDNAPNAQQTIALAGTGNGPLVNLPAALTFPSEPVGTTGPAQTVTLTNAGNANLVISTVTITGANEGDFSKSADTCSGTTVTPNGTCSVGITFTPSGAGTRTALLNFPDNAANSPQTVNLSGTGNSPNVLLSVSSLSFTNEPVGTKGGASTVTLTNNGAANLTVSTVTIIGANPGDFSKSADTCSGTTVAPNGTCSVSVTFTPTASGSRTATLNFPDNASNSPQMVTLSGTGTDFTIAVSPSSGTATESTPAAYTLTLTPVSGFASAVSLACAGAPVGSVCSVSPANVTPNGIAVTAAVKVSVSSSSFVAPSNWTTPAPPQHPLRFEGLLAGGMLSLIGLAMLSLARRRQGGGIGWSGAAIILGVATTSLLAWVACGGKSTPPPPPSQPDASLSSPSLSFNPQNVGSSSAAQGVTLSNSGNATLNVSSITIAGTNASDFSETNTCGSTVAAGANCSISVTFTPTGDGSRSGTLKVTDNASGSPQPVNVSGTGQTTATLTFTATSGTLGHDTTAGVTVQ